jgi:hypothetical protein
METICGDHLCKECADKYYEEARNYRRIMAPADSSEWESAVKEILIESGVSRLVIGHLFFNYPDVRTDVGRFVGVLPYMRLTSNGT